MTKTEITQNKQKIQSAKPVGLTSLWSSVPPTPIATAYCAGQYKCQYRDNLIGRSFFSEDGTVIVTGKERRNETTTTDDVYMACLAIGIPNKSGLCFGNVSRRITIRAEGW